MKILLEYIWIDGSENIRSKNKIVYQSNDINSIDDVLLWNFDGSSTDQATGKKSDIILKPVRLYKNPFININIMSYLVLCECYNKDMTPHITNNRANCLNPEGCLFGIEQEYTLFDRYDNPYQWLTNDNPGKGGQGPYYCSVGGDRAFGRHISQEHLEYCIESGVNICGTNAEVMASQWEYQIGICDALQVSDDLWMSRYILHRITEKYNCYATFYPKPKEGDWNGTGGHTNFSTKEMRDPNGIEHILVACEKLKLAHTKHMLIYGKNNDKRLSGQHETSNMEIFTYGISDRGCSIRIPINVFNDKCGYLEDRRPASNLDPYLVTNIIIETVCM